MNKSLTVFSGERGRGANGVFDIFDFVAPIDVVHVKVKIAQIRVPSPMKTDKRQAYQR